MSKKISDLIAELEIARAAVGDVPVLVSGYEDDYDTPRTATIVTVADKGAEAKADAWWNGRYEDAETANSNLPRFTAVVIPR